MRPFKEERGSEMDKWISFSSDYSLIALFDGFVFFLLLFRIKFIEFVLILMLSNYIRFKCGRMLFFRSLLVCN